MNKIFNFLRMLKYKDRKYDTASNNSIKIFWWNDVPNVGDALNQVLFGRLMNNDVEWVPHSYNEEHFLAIGSIVQKANGKTIIWGSGLISNKMMPYRRPKEILAVRGPLTMKSLASNKIWCPEVYGDPALLLPKYYAPKIDKKFKYGLIPHYADMNHPFFNKSVPDDFKIISPLTNNIENFIQDILMCESILSSSLHGLVFSDAYGIPSAHVKFSNNVFGDGFKFYDYHFGINKKYNGGEVLTDNVDYSRMRKIETSLPGDINIEKLINNCPF